VPMVSSGRVGALPLEADDLYQRSLCRLTALPSHPAPCWPAVHNQGRSVTESLATRCSKTLSTNR
jgi:hypothetical protein